eukprot:COSAG06_NODE_7649_length_2423_cov_2.797767_3_plen_25_part_01
MTFNIEITNGTPILDHTLSGRGRVH